VFHPFAAATQKLACHVKAGVPQHGLACIQLHILRSHGLLHLFCALLRRLQVVEYGRFEMDTWYYSPYPEPYASCHKLYICEYSLKYFRKKATLLRHLAKLEARHPPGQKHNDRSITKQQQQQKAAGTPGGTVGTASAATVAAVLRGDGSQKQQQALG
jgi:hypothetical protein